MKLNLASSQSVKVRIIEYEDADIISLVNGGKTSEITIAVNADRRQKEALVQFRKDLLARIINLGFKIEVENVVKDGETIEVPKNTEGAEIGRFIDALTTGELTPDGFTLPSGDDKVKEIAAYAFLQTLALSCGDEKTPDGLPCYVLDVSRPVRTSTSSNLLPKWTLEAATKILAGPNVASWKAKFANGFTSPKGIVIDPIVVASFDSPGNDEATITNNRKALARGLVEYDKQERAKTANEFV
jgi:hypothetical protein